MRFSVLQVFIIPPVPASLVCCLWSLGTLYSDDGNGVVSGSPISGLLLFVGMFL